jgi:hypothetical protein
VPRDPSLGPSRKDVPDLDADEADPALDEAEAPEGLGPSLDVPFWPQSLDFSCGPASLLMAMAHHDPSVERSRAHEIDLWREANLVEIGATSRYGLALAAHRRGFQARIVGNVDGVAYLEALREKVDLDVDMMRLFAGDLQRRCREEADVAEEIRPVTVADIERTLFEGGVPIVLTDTRMFTPDEEIPHWVVVTAVLGDEVRVHNPLDDSHRAHEAIAIDGFLDGFGYGGDQVMVAVGPRPG